MNGELTLWNTITKKVYLRTSTKDAYAALRSVVETVMEHDPNVVRTDFAMHWDPDNAVGEVRFGQDVLDLVDAARVSGGIE